MSHFFKVFVILISITCAFAVGRNYGESVYINSEEYKAIQSKKEYILDLEKQNLELKNQIEKAATVENSKVAIQDFNSVQEPKNNIKKQEKATVRPALKISAEQFKNYEWLLDQKTNSTQNEKTSESLKTLSHLNINNFSALVLEDASTSTQGLENKEFRGSFYDNSLESFGSAILSFKNKNLKLELLQDGKSQVSFEVIDFESQLKKAKEFSFRFLNSDQKYLQIYTTNKGKQIAGRLYEVLPNETTKPIGMFILKSSFELK